MTDLQPERSGSTAVDRFFAIPMVLIGITFPLFKFGTASVRNSLAWPCLGTGLALTAVGLLYCAWSRRSPGWGGLSCGIGASIVGLLAFARYGPPW
ncbi:hypothetical protein EF910_17735 [Streptomyces sp. WAC07149]|uniref:hypothetical protein n=1 Tax=Streptomyces sp. WAC07149 TaxID=2487425 RepID=UPI000F7AB4AB|nr:hypothetical protein [Streptomyces sp. WAC07149]RST04375.1 hypothetical protein EF910_17735 [Streptomyces sp. WAC07149]